MTYDPLQDLERLECLVHLCAFDGDALYEIAWGLWTRFPELRVRSAETTRALAATIERLVTVGALELRWSTWEPHTIGELIPADEVHDVLGTEQWWKPS